MTIVQYDRFIQNAQSESKYVLTAAMSLMGENPKPQNLYAEPLTLSFEP